MRIPSLIALSVAVSLANGCALFDRSAPSSPSAPATPRPVISPVTEVTHGAADPDYQMGRYYQGRHLDDAAITAYRKALAADAGNAEAYNGLGVIYARQGRYAEAEQAFLAAIGLKPKAAHLYNNLGYCYLLQDRKAEALAQFRLAQGIEPDNRRLEENIRLAEGGRPPAPAPVPVPAKATGGNGLVAVAPNVYELPAPAPARPSAAAATIATSPVQGLEVANGNGITGLARRTARYLAEHGVVRQARITNQKPYTQAVTEIQYRPGHEHQALTLNALLARPGKLITTERLRPAVAVRVVLGRDLARRPLFADESNRADALARADQ